MCLTSEINTIANLDRSALELVFRYFGRPTPIPGSQLASENKRNNNNDKKNNNKIEDAKTSLQQAEVA